MFKNELFPNKSENYHFKIQEYFFTDLMAALPTQILLLKIPASDQTKVPPCGWKIPKTVFSRFFFFNYFVKNNSGTYLLLLQFSRTNLTNFLNFTSTFLQAKRTHPSFFCNDSLKMKNSEIKLFLKYPHTETDR